ncbi:MAG: head-tail adaptor protein [Sulfuricaulis sp.]|nr:head-tail adaptor protein [Sulfuricaulis sp.]
MRAGLLDKQITIEQKQVTVDPTYGTELVSWIPLVAEAGSPTVAVRFWAEVKDALPSRSESVTQGLAVARNQSRLRMRYRSDVTSDMRVTVHGSADVVYQIVGGPAVIGRNEWLEMVIERYSS